MKLDMNRRSTPLAFAMTAATIAAFATIGPTRVPAQDVALVKVDVSVLAKGYRASKLIGSGVVNDKNEKIGSIDDLILSQDKVLAAVLQVGGFLGIASRRVAVPYESLQLEEAAHKIVLPGATKDELRKLAEVQS
jgi:sporulation protein YlmC with PRC-barrel domain